MAENIGGGSTNPFSSGGHAWVWDGQEIVSKEFGAVAIQGAGSMVLRQGPRGGVVQGVLRTTGETLAAAQAALTVLEQAIEALAAAGTASAWEDDQGHGGDALVLKRYQRLGPRQVGQGATIEVWQFYRCEVRNLAGTLVPPEA